MKTNNLNGVFKMNEQQKQNMLRFALFSVCMLVLMNNDMMAQAGTVSSKINTLYSWLKPITHAILGVFCLVKLVTVVYKFFFAQREAGGDFMWLIVGLAVWGLFFGFANEIFQLFGGSGNAVN